MIPGRTEFALDGRSLSLAPSRPASPDRPMRREDPSARGQGARQWRAAHATATAGWMGSRRPARAVRTWFRCIVGDTATCVAAGDGRCAQGGPYRPGTAFRAGARIPKLCHGPHGRERPARVTVIIVDRHGVLTLEPARRDRADRSGGRRPARPGWSRGRLEDHLGPALIACVEVLVGVRCLSQWKRVRDDEGRLRAIS